MKERLLIIIVFSVIISGCQSQSSTLKSDKTVHLVFGKEEIRDLEKILSFFDDLVCKQDSPATENVISCYRNLLNRMKNDATSGNVDVQISNNKIQQLLNQIGDGTFDQIWYLRGVDSNQSDAIDINLEGKYFAFLDEVGKTNPKIRIYCEKLRNSGVVSPSMVSDILYDHEEYNIEEEKIRLIIAIHYLTINN